MFFKSGDEVKIKRSVTTLVYGGKVIPKGYGKIKTIIDACILVDFEDVKEFAVAEDEIISKDSELPEIPTAKEKKYFVKEIYSSYCKSFMTELINLANLFEINIHIIDMSNVSGNYLTEYMRDQKLTDRDFIVSSYMYSNTSSDVNELYLDNVKIPINEAPYIGGVRNFAPLTLKDDKEHLIGVGYPEGNLICIPIKWIALPLERAIYLIYYVLNKYFKREFKSIENLETKVFEDVFKTRKKTIITGLENQRTTSMNNLNSLNTSVNTELTRLKDISLNIEALKNPDKFSKKICEFIKKNENYDFYYEKNLVIGITKNDIIMEFEKKIYNLGKFSVCFNISTTNEQAITIFSVKNPLMNYPHPHVSSGTVCWGDALGSIKDAIISLNIEKIFDIVLNFLCSYNRPGQYQGIEYITIGVPVSEYMEQMKLKVNGEKNIVSAKKLPTKKSRQKKVLNIPVNIQETVEVDDSVLREHTDEMPF